MPIATIAPVSVASVSGNVSNNNGILTDNNNGIIYYWPVGNSGSLYADINTDATTVLPSNAIITHWKVNYKVAYTPTTYTVYPTFRRNPNVSTETITDYAMTSGWSSLTYPNPEGPNPNGFAISTYNTPSDFSVVRIGGTRPTGPAAESWQYIDYFTVSVIYRITGASILFTGENF